MVKIQLLNKVESEGIEIDTLEFREPIAEDIVVCGYPFKIIVGSATDVTNAGNQEMQINTGVLAQLASRLASVPVSTIKKFSVIDFNKIINVISNFFG